MSDSNTVKCTECGKPLVDGQATYAGRMHWECHENVNKQAALDIDRMSRPELIALVKRLLRLK